MTFRDWSSDVCSPILSGGTRLGFGSFSASDPGVGGSAVLDRDGVRFLRTGGHRRRQMGQSSRGFDPSQACAMRGSSRPSAGPRANSKDPRSRDSVSSPGHHPCQAQAVFVVSDGGVWIWKIEEDRFVEAIGVLDFYHVSQHLWAVAHQLHPQDGEQARQWIDPLLSQMKAGQAAQIVQRLEELIKRGDDPCQPLEKELHYFKEHREHMQYDHVRQQGAPIGSRAMESFCSQLQHRSKRAGQFWNTAGLNCLLSLEVAKRNLDWDQICPIIKTPRSCARSPTI